MRNKCDLCDFERCIVVGARRACLGFSETAVPRGFSWTAIISTVCKEWSEGKKKESIQQVAGLWVKMPEVREGWSDCLEAIKRQ